jgi:pilus assembly protein Flp/PilA
MAAAGFRSRHLQVMDMKTSEASQRTERGASAVEYGMLIVGIAGVLVLIVIALGTTTSGLFNDTCDAIADKVGANC